MMPLVKVENLTFSYDGCVTPVFDNVSFSFDTNWKIGLIGRNGIGKSTLFKLLLNKEPYRGFISGNKGFTELLIDVEDTSQTGLDVFAKLTRCEEWKLLREVNLLKMDSDLVYRKFETLSMGERTKILLAISFSMDNGFMLIDEPTNHLDMIGRQLVSRYLKNKKGFLLISHDRDFLDGCIDHVICMNRSSIDVQTGNFSSWYENKIRKDRFEIDQNEKLKKDIKRLREAAVQSKIWSDKIENTKNGVKVSGIKPDKGHIGRQSAKMMKRSKNLEKRQNKTVEIKQNLLKDVETAEKLKLLSLPFTHTDSAVIAISRLSVYYGKKHILDHAGFELKQGEVTVLDGRNGSGKSTLLRMLVEPDQICSCINYKGTIKMARNLKISYVEQDISFVRGSLNKWIRARDVDETLCKAILRKLDFPRELFEMDMKNYSNGQKKKVLIAVSLSKPAHVYIWDEPLNYIDVISRMQIEEMIREEKPTLLLVEHDRRFVKSVADHIVEVS